MSDALCFEITLLESLHNQAKESECNAKGCMCMGPFSGGFDYLHVLIAVRFSTSHLH